MRSAKEEAIYLLSLCDNQKAIAILIVDEIYKHQPFDVYSMFQSENVNKYWNDVRKEINNLESF